MFHTAGGSKYPWMSDPNWTDTWIADSSYLDTTGSVGVWNPQKGSIPIVQATGANKPTYSAAWGAGNKGLLTFDGVNDWMSGDALAAKVTGNLPWTMILSVQLTSVVSFTEVFAFSNTSTSSAFHVLQPDNSTPSKKIRVSYSDNVGARRDSGTTFVADTTRRVITVSFDPSTVSYDVRINGVDGTLPPLGVSSTVATITKFTLAAIRDSSSAASFSAQKLRGVLFMPRTFLASACIPAENYLIAEAA